MDLCQTEIWKVSTCLAGATLIRLVVPPLSGSRTNDGHRGRFSLAPSIAPKAVWLHLPLLHHLKLRAPVGLDAKVASSYLYSLIYDKKQFYLIISNSR